MKKKLILGILILLGIITGLYLIVSAAIGLLEGLLSIIAWVLIILVFYYALRNWLNR